MKDPVKTFVGILTVITLVSSIGYSYVKTLSPSVISVLYIAFLYMPIPFYTLLFVNRLQNKKNNLSQYGWFTTLNRSGIAATILLFLGWIAVFALFHSILSNFIPEITGKFVLSEHELRNNLASLGGQDAADSANLPNSIPLFIGIAFVSAVISGFTINLLFALGEEYGWRGFLNKHIRGNFVKKHSIIGLIWGVWHAPLILQGYNYGSEYNFLGTIMFVFFAVCFGYVFGVLIERYKNVVYAGALHGMFNGFAGVFTILIGSYHPVIGGPVGIISAAAFLVVAFIAYRLLKISYSESRS